MNASNSALAAVLVFALTQTACASSASYGNAATSETGAAASAAESGSEGAATGSLAKSTPARSRAEPVATHYWFDGDRRRELTIDPERVADFRGASAATRDAGTAGTPALAKSTPAGSPLRPKAAVEKEPGGALPEGVSPVLREASAPASQVRALPGGVIVTLKAAPASTDPAAREAQARRELAEAQLEPLRPLDPSHRTWLVASPAGLASLELANRLHESGRFESASPNWWRPRALK